jgi:hypothetical protein
MQREARSTQGQASTRGLLRAALLGLCGGLLLGGLSLMGLAAMTRLSPVNCADLSEEECTFSRDTEQQMGRFQGMAGAALLALGLASMVLVLKEKQTSRDRGTGPRAP